MPRLLFDPFVMLPPVELTPDIRAPPVIQPTRSLFSLWFLVTTTNLAAVFFHVIGEGEGGYDTKGLMLDFVGQGEL